MKCVRCATENHSDARFCSSCGASLGKDAPGAPDPAMDNGALLHEMSRHIPPALADKISKQGEQKVSERRHVTVLFADISGFTAMSEALDPEVVRGVLNSCFKELVEVVFKYEGTIDKFIGDEIMALFGVPVAHENDPERALRAAVEMRERLRRFSSELQVPLPKPLTMHAGINTGEVIAGGVGSDLRMDYSVIGDTVNLAARLASAAGQDQIFVSDRTYALARYMIDCKALRPLRVQGKKKKVQAYEVNGIRASQERKYGVQAAYGPLVGREEEVSLLKSTVEAVRQGQGRVVGMSGEAGTGKSRLVHELQGMAEGFTVVSSPAVSYETPPAYQVFGDLMRKLFGIEADEQEEIIRQKIETWAIARGLPADLVPRLGSLLGLRDEALVHATDAERFAGVRKAVDSVLRLLADEKPLLLVLEDLQWADQQSRTLLDEIVVEAGAFPILLCCVYRPELRHDWARFPWFACLPVTPLSREKTRDLSAALLKLDIPPALDQLIADRTEGNPFYVEEMIKALIDEGVIEKTRTGFRIAKDVSELRLPGTIQGVIMARIDRLEKQAQETLRYAAVIGRSFPQALLESVSPQGDVVKGHLGELEGLELVFQQSVFPELEFIFKHFVTREVVYNSILVDRRKVIHLEVAKAMERSYADRLSDKYESLANHFEAGEDWKKAAEYYGLAGSRARELHTDKGAEVLMERKERAVQKVFEQREGLPWARYLIAGFVVLVFCISVYDLLKFGGSSIPYLVYVLVGFAMLVMRGVALFTRSEVVRSATIYADHLSIGGSKRSLQIAFGDIQHVRWVCQRKWSDLFRWVDVLRLSTRNSQYFYGGFRILEALKYVYANRAHELIIDHSGGTPVRLNTLSAGVLYQELKMAVSKWGALHTTRPAVTFRGSLSRFEEQNALLFRSEPDSRGAHVGYDHLIQMVKKGEAEGGDEVGVEGPQHTTSWVRLDRASKEDHRLRASLHPLRHGLKALLKSPFLWIPISYLLPGLLLTWIPSVYALVADSVRGVSAGVLPIYLMFCVAAILLWGLFPLYLAGGAFAWIRRFRVARWLSTALRVMSVIVVALALVVCIVGSGIVGKLIFPSAPWGNG